MKRKGLEISAESIEKKVKTEKDYEQLEEFLENKGWRSALDKVFKEGSWKNLKKNLQERENKGIILYPPKELTWTALELTPLENVKIVILGQDPYVLEGQAHGLSFSVPNGKEIPPSLVNIFKELADNYPDFGTPSHGNLEKWAQQGVLLLNSSLSVEQKKPGSCSDIGWKRVTSAILQAVNNKKDPCVFIAWGLPAQQTLKSVKVNSRHLSLTAGHPSPKSADRFFKCKHFVKANDFLSKKKRGTVDWILCK